jgi:flagellar biosynthesis GTPase FlhF
MGTFLMLMGLIAFVVTIFLVINGLKWKISTKDSKGRFKQARNTLIATFILFIIGGIITPSSSDSSKNVNASEKTEQKQEAKAKEETKREETKKEKKPKEETKKEEKSKEEKSKKDEVPKVDSKKEENIVDTSSMNQEDKTNYYLKEAITDGELRELQMPFDGVPNMIIDINTTASLTNKFTVAGMKSDITASVKTLLDNDLLEDADIVSFDFFMPATNDFGEESEIVVLVCQISVDNMKRINWDNVTYPKWETIADRFDLNDQLK